MSSAVSFGAGKLSDITESAEYPGKRLQVQVVEVAENTLAIRCLDWDRDRFDIEFALQEGTTYNSYLIFGEEKTCLVDASHEKFRGAYLPALQAEVVARGRAGIDYLVCSHTEPDHSGLVADVTELFPSGPQTTVVGSKVCLQFLAGLNPGKELTTMEVKGGSVVDLGGGHELEFTVAPNLHWPDTMFSYDRKTGVMYTCDAFGSHLCTEAPFDVGLHQLLPHYRFYYDCLMKPNARSVLTALRKIKSAGWEPTTVANGHGPMLHYNLTELMDKYKSWSEEAGSATASVCVLYAAEYGHGDRLSQTLARGITKAGCAVEMADVLSVDPQELVAMVSRSGAVVMMAPPASSKEARNTMAVLLSCIKSKQKAIIAESFGGEDEPVDTMAAQFTNVGVELAAKPLRVKATPDAAMYQLYEETGTDLAQQLTSKEAIAAKKAAMSADVAKALARVSGGLYVVTASNGSARSAMIASWVSQASFEPPGLTVAVAHDRAIESLMQVGDSFVLNCLGDKSVQPIMKHFLTRFPAGADRFKGVDHFEGSNGVPVLSDAVAHMECRVVSRMEASDHWVVYAEVTAGGVADPDAQTSVHRRKVATYY
ncbi:unnamed protein product [Pedinophyceae sp. YPF-701]|nr:unnamed protein product [Pedinophyceae sp. YPF-701]